MPRIPRCLSRVAACSIAFVCIGVGCTLGSKQQSTPVPSVVFYGDQRKIDALATAVRQGRIKVKPAWITDLRKLRGDILLRTEYDGGTAQLRVETVSDFFTCLFQFRQGISTAEIISKHYPYLKALCHSDTCDVCYSWTYPLDARVRSAVIEYWLVRLDQLNRGAPSPRGKHGNETDELRRK